MRKLNWMFAGLCALAFAGAVHASDNTGNLDLSIGYISAPGSHSGLEQDLSHANGGVSVSCTEAVTVHTGGTMGQATAGLCSFGGADAVWACRNDMVGTTGKQKFIDPTLSAGLSLTTLIVASCMGG